MPRVQDPPVLTKTITDEEVERFRREEKKRREEEAKAPKVGNTGHEGATGRPPNPKDWDEGRDGLIQFLEKLKKVLTHVIQKRVVIEPTKLAEPDPLFNANLADATKSIDEVIKQLQDDKTGEKWYSPLKKVGCVGRAWWVKFRDFTSAISTKPLAVVLEIADTILDSLSTAFPVLEPVRELKEIAESRIKYGGDKPLIQDLGLSGQDPIEYDSKVTAE